LGFAGRLILSVALAAATALAASRLLAERGHGGLPFAATSFTLFLLLIPYFLGGLSNFYERLGTWLDRRPARLFGASALLLVPYVIYALGTDTFTAYAALKLTVFVLGPAVLVAFGPSSFAKATADKRLRWTDALAILALWLPLDFRLFRDVWSWPEGGAAYTLNVVLAVDLALLLFVAYRRLEGVGYRFRVGSGDLSAYAINLAICLAFVVPLGLATGFVRFNPDTGAASFAFSFLAIFLTIAVPEELLFRGLIQNFLQKTWMHPGRALVVTSVVFGLAHLNNGPQPDWRYVLLATIAGFFYGRAYLQSGGLMAAALLHASIDAIWRGFF
jgi:uncharacterized protein